MRHEASIKGVVQSYSNHFRLVMATMDVLTPPPAKADTLFINLPEKLKATRVQCKYCNNMDPFANHVHHSTKTGALMFESLAMTNQRRKEHAYFKKQRRAIINEKSTPVEVIPFMTQCDESCCKTRKSGTQVSVYRQCNDCGQTLCEHCLSIRYLRYRPLHHFCSARQ